MKTRHPMVAAIVACSLAFAALSFDNVSAQSSMYLGGYAPVDYSNIGPNGGSISVTYTLEWGPEVPGLGSSYQVIYSFSDLTGVGATAGNDYTWGGAPSPYVGMLPNQASLRNNLPTNNSRPFDSAFGGMDDARVRREMDLGNLDLLGTFTVTSSSAPVISGYRLIQDEVSYVSAFNSMSVSGGPWDGDIVTGWWAAPQDAIRGGGEGPGSAYYPTKHGEVVPFEFTAWSDPDPQWMNHNFWVNPTDRPIWSIGGRMIYAPIPIPEPSAVFIGSLGLLTLLHRRRR